MAGELQLEAQAFDNQIVERVQNGHIPDLRRTEKCEYFYNNVWRHPEYVKLSFVEQFERISDTIKKYVRKGEIRVLEVGCGPGYLSLELARAGMNVVGLDISTKAIEVAVKLAESDPWKEERGQLEYLVGDFFTEDKLREKSFDAIVFLGALHHFKNQDEVMRRASELLNENGLMLAHEPTRDRVTPGNAAILHLIKLLLSSSQGFYAEQPIPNGMEEYSTQLESLYKTMKYEDDHGQKVQSINDNEAGYKEMYAALTGHYNELVLEDRSAFYTEIIGGLRFDEQKNIALAKFIKDADIKLRELGILQATEFFFAGRKKES